MTPEQAEQLYAMSRADIIRKYLKMLTSRRITKGEYEAVLEQYDLHHYVRQNEEEKAEPMENKEFEGLTQVERIEKLLSDYEWHSTPDILRTCYGADHLGVARIGARIFDLKSQGLDIICRKKGGSIHEYRMVNPHKALDEGFWQDGNTKNV